MKQAGWRLFVKVACDRAAAAAGLVVTAPIIAAAAVAVRASMGAPVFFRQERPGRHGKTFRVVKFRTMSNATDAEGRLLPDEQRLTLVGAWLRSSSLDELPQLFNVLTGDLSLVGPRPLLVRYLPRYSPEQARRHEVLPGITGWAQINGRNAIDWNRKFELDVWYVDNWSLRLDARILWRTLRAVLLREGISSEGHATMPEFMGARQFDEPRANS